MRFNLCICRIKLTPHLARKGQHDLSQTMIHWSSHLPNAINT